MKARNKRLFAVLLVAFLVLFSMAFAISANAGTVTTYVENDFVNDTDANYTHGTRFSYTEGSYEYFVGQGIYTPSDKDSYAPVPNDRPYAGWLYAGASKTFERWTLHNTVEASLGVVGPSSLAQEAQDGIHILIANGTPNGWDNQLKDEPAIQARYKAQKAFGLVQFKELSAVIVPNSEACIGTVMDYVGSGADLVFGLNPESYLNNQIPVKAIGKKFSAYGFVGACGRVVAWNMLLDGNMYHDSVSVDKETFVYDLQAGGCLAYGLWSVTYTEVVRSREFEQQGTAEVFGALALVVAF